MSKQIGRRMEERFVHDELPQGIYDAYNEFIFSKDSKLLNKLFSKQFFVNLTKDVPGDIVELGVFKGSGFVAWLKVCRLEHVKRMVYGFDYFDAEKLVSGINTADRSLMASLFTSRDFDSKGYEHVLKRITQDIGFTNFALLAGDVFSTVPDFLAQNPGFRASIINFDLDTAEPTIFALNQFWDRLVPGGVLIFDEYAINEWTESDAVDEFIRSKGLRLKYTNIDAPTAYLIRD